MLHFSSSANVNIYIIYISKYMIYFPDMFLEIRIKIYSFGKNSFEAYVCRLVGPRLLIPTHHAPKTLGSSSAETQKWKNSDKMGISVGLPIPLVIAPTIAPEDDKPSSHGQKRLVKRSMRGLVGVNVGWMNASYMIMFD